MAVSHRGAISFGMFHIPVGLYTATQDNDIHFNQLCKEDGSRVKSKKVCAGCRKEIGSGDIVKGFEYENVTLGVGGESFQKIRSLPKIPKAPMDVPENHEQTIWVEAKLACTVEYMKKTESGGLPQPVFKGLREDKSPEECEED